MTPDDVAWAFRIKFFLKELASGRRKALVWSMKKTRKARLNSMVARRSIKEKFKKDGG